MRLRFNRRGQRAGRRAAMGEACHDRRDRPRSVGQGLNRNSSALRQIKEACDPGDSLVRCKLSEFKDADEQGRSAMTMHFPRDSATVHPPSLFPYYKSTLKRAPKRPLMILPHTETELTGPAYGHEVVRPEDSDLTRQHEGEPLGQRIIVSVAAASRERTHSAEYAYREL